jgi:hypothetical protein
MHSNQSLVICTLDLLTAICLVTGVDFWVLVSQVTSSTNKNILNLVDTCTKEEVSLQIRQSACALLGETAKVLTLDLVALSNEMMPLLFPSGLRTAACPNFRRLDAKSYSQP